jgi:molybdenum cofactor cytidylyltransferase
VDADVGFPKESHLEPLNVKSKPPGPFAFGAVILGAGRSARMGRPKLLLPWGRTSILGHLLAQWRSLGALQIAIVCAVDDQAMKAELERLGIPSQDCVFNPAPERGMFSSIQCAARWPGWKPDLTHWAFVLGDQPHLRKETLEAVLDLCAKQPAKVCQPAYRGNRRHPVLLPKAVFTRLAGSVAGTLKEFLAAYEIVACETDDAGLDLDIDQPEDYERAQQWWNQNGKD